MTPVDIAVYATIALVALAPFAGPAVSLISSIRLPKPAVDESAWTRDWADRLIQFIGEAEGGQMVGNTDEAQRLARQLIWQLIGGDEE